MTTTGTSPARRRRGWLFLLPAGIFIALMAAFYLGLGRDTNTLPSPLINKPAPHFKLPPLVAGQPGFSSADLIGHVSLVNTFASWCAPCRSEEPVLVALAKTGRVAIYGINYKDNAQAARAWLAELGNPYTRVGADDGRVAIEWGVYGVPETYLVDRTGRIRYKHVGPLTSGDIERTMLPMIARLER